jgi:hypothetical protein
MRKKFAEPERAQDFKNHLDLNYWNDGAVMRPVLTKFTDDQLTELGYCLSRLNGRYTLSEAVTFFVDHHRDISDPTRLGPAISAYRTDIEKRIRARTTVQKKSVLGQFEEAIGKDEFVHAVSTEAVHRFLIELRAKNGTDPASPKTFNNYKSDLHSFFEWCKAKPRRWLNFNPAADVPTRIVEQGEVHILKPGQCRKLMSGVRSFKEGKLVPYFALALFAGLRPGGELEKLAERSDLINLQNGTIRIPPDISKTRRARSIEIRSNLKAWLFAYNGAILPINSDREIKTLRKQFGLSHDILRHTFISAHVKAFGSFADAAIESGNSERIIRDHYYNAMTEKEAKAFWNIRPPKSSKSKNVVRMAA